MHRTAQSQSHNLAEPKQHSRKPANTYLFLQTAESQDYLHLEAAPVLSQSWVYSKYSSLLTEWETGVLLLPEAGLMWTIEREIATWIQSEGSVAGESVDPDQSQTV